MFDRSDKHFIHSKFSEEHGPDRTDSNCDVRCGFDVVPSNLELAAIRFKSRFNPIPALLHQSVTVDIIALRVVVELVASFSGVRDAILEFEF